MKISLDENIVELSGPPEFNYGKKVKSLKTVLHDGTFQGREIVDILVNKGDIGYVTRICTLLQQFYIYAVEFVEHGYRVGMRGKELDAMEEVKPQDQEVQF